MVRNQFIITVLTITFICMISSNPPVKGAITAAGDFSPDPLCGSNGIVASSMYIPDYYNTEAWLWVTEGDTLTTEQASYIAQLTGAKGSVYVTDSTWIANGAVFLSSQFSSVSTIGLDNATWEVYSNMAMAQNDNGIVNVTASNGSYWYVENATRIASDDDTEVNITLNDSTWYAYGMVYLSMDGFFPSDGYGTININTNSVMDCINGMYVGDKGTFNLDGGELTLHSETRWNGTISITSNGGSINVVIGPYLADMYAIELYDSLDFSNGTINITFEPDFVEYPIETYDLFDPMDSADLSAILSTADDILTPPGWILDLNTGVLSFLPIQDCLLGPDVAATPICQDTHDYDSDGDVDLEDFAEYQRIYAD